MSSIGPSSILFSRYFNILVNTLGRNNHKVANTLAIIRFLSISNQNESQDDHIGDAKYNNSFIHLLGDGKRGN